MSRRIDLWKLAIRHLFQSVSGKKPAALLSIQKQVPACIGSSSTIGSIFGWRFFFQRFGSTFFFPRFGSTPPSRFLVTVIIFGLLDTKNVNCHRDRRGHAILVTVDVFRVSDGVRNPKMSTVTGIVEGRLAIRVTVDVFRLSDVLNSRMSTVTGIAEGPVAILPLLNSRISLKVEKGSPCRFLLSAVRSCLRMRCYEYEGGVGGGGGAPPPSAKHRIGWQSVTSC